MFITVQAQFIQKTDLKFHYTAKLAKVWKSRYCLGKPTSMSLVFSYWLSVVQEIPRGRQIPVKRRQHFIESSDEEDLWTISVKCAANFHSPKVWIVLIYFNTFTSTSCWLFKQVTNPLARIAIEDLHRIKVAVSRWTWKMTYGRV